MGSSGTSPPWDTPAVRRTVIPLAIAEAANSSHKRLLPTPGSPTMPITWARPSAARFSASSRRAISDARPTSREVARPPFERGGAGPSRTNTPSGTRTPLTVIGPRSLRRNQPSTRRAVCSVR